MLASPTRSLKTFALLARIALGLVVAAWLLFGASWAALHWVIVPRIAQWQPDIERLASQRLGVELRIGQIVLDNSTAVPSFTLQDVQLLDANQRPALHLPRVHATLSVSSVWRLGFEQLVIDGPLLEVRRKAEGRWQLGGLVINTESANAGTGNTAVLDWLLGQSELAILNGSLRYTDETQPDAEPLVLTDISWVNRHQHNTLHMRLDARPPADWGEALSVQGEFKYPFWVRRAGDWQQWQGQWFADLPHVDWSRLPLYTDTTPVLGLQVLEGSGGARAWADMVDGQVRNITLDMRLRAAALQWPGQEAPVAMRALSGRLHFDRNRQTIHVATEQLAFTTREGVVWPGGNFRYSQRLDANNSLARMRFESNDLDALALSQLAKDMPLPAAWQTELQQVAPQGRIEQLDMDWSHEQGGNALIRLAQASLNTRKWFDEPRMQFDQLQGRLQWSTQEGMRVEVTDLRVSNADVQAQASVLWRADDANPSHPGHLRLEATVDRAQANRIYRYLPKKLGPNVLRYLQASIKEGQAMNGRFHVQGNLAHFPFDQHPGQFEVSAQLRDVLFDYAPAHIRPKGSAGWPALMLREGELHIGPENIDIRHAKAHVAKLPNLELPSTQATITQYVRGPSTVQVSGPINGPANEVLSFIQQSTLGNMLKQTLANASASGPVQGELALHIPLKNTEATTVKGKVLFNNTTLRIRPDIPILSQTKGTLTFSEQGFNVDQAKAQVLGGAATINATLQGAGAQRALTVLAQGQATASGLAQDPALVAYAGLARQLQGQASYTLRWNQQGAANRFVLESDLQGMGSQLPAPFQKTTAQALPLRVEFTPLRHSRAARDEVVLQLGNVNTPWLAARYLREERNGQMQILRGAIGVNTRAPGLPANGVLANIQLDTLQTHAWSSLWEGGIGSDPSPWVPTSVALQARMIEAGAYTLNQVQLRANQVSGDWEAQVQSQEVVGRINWVPSTGQIPGRVQARLSRLHLTSGSGDTIDNLIRQDPLHVPAVDVVADDFQLDGRPLGRLEMLAVNRFVVQNQRPDGHEWRLQTLQLTTPEARFQATGNWAASPQDPTRRRTAMNMVLEIDDAGQLLSRFGMPGVIRGGQGQIEGNLGWVGSPLNFNKRTLAGELTLQVNRGQFLQAEPGAARLIGVLNLQSLPRRLALDFKDVFSEGFAFDFVRGNVQVAQGMARTNNLQMKGVTAAVLIEGEADVLQETQDLMAVIIPDLSTGTATLVTTLINPVTGITALLGQFLLRQPLQEAATRQFHVTGSWGDPKITPVSRSNLPQNGGTSTPSVSAP
jgi:uncharacterized protein YhdP